MSYKFNPLDYGYEPVEKFPELKGILSDKHFVKVVTISNSERPTYWYSTCRDMLLHGDERWQFYGGAWQEGSENSLGHSVYLGTISSHEFAESLLMHLMGTCKNSGVEDWGRQRFEQNINAFRLDGKSFE